MAKDVQQVANDLQDKKEKLKGKKRQAEKDAPIHENGNDLPLKEKLEDLPVYTVDECDAAIEEARASLEKYSANPEVLRLYEELKESIAVMEDKVANSAQNRQGMSVGIEKKLELYVHPLEDYVSKVSAKFSQYMGEMDCTGEVKLVKNGEDGRNFKEW